MIVGGRPFDYTQDDVRTRMRGVAPEPIREHLVEMLGTVYPPKQVLATVTRWDRRSFTTLEARRVLTKLGFTCRRASAKLDGHAGWIVDDPEPVATPEPVVSSLEERLAAAESALAVATQAIAGLLGRVAVLEAAVSGRGQAGCGQGGLP